MNDFEEAINSDLNWRLGEIAILKSLTVQSHLSARKKAIARKYSIPALYAVWEGYIVNSFKEYVKIINSQQLSFSDLNDSITTKHMFTSLSLHQPPQSFEKKKRLVRKIQDMMSAPVQLPLEINTGSNVDYAELQNICNRYAVNSEQLEKYKVSLNKFLNYRNRIAHGDNAISVEPEHIIEFSQTVVSLMSDISEILNVHVMEKKYLSLSHECNTPMKN